MMDKNDSAAGMYVALAAPSGIGKTSLVSALLDEANQVLAGTRVAVEAVGPTRTRLNKLQNALRGHLRGREFVAEGIGGTQDIAKYWLKVQATGTDRSFNLHVLDYPGGLLDGRSGEQWNEVARWFNQADALVLPIDASLLMEASTSREHECAEACLNVAEIEAIATRQWAKGRVAHADGSGLLVLAPLKTETYFADNGGHQDKSDELYRRVIQTYQPLIDAVRRETSLVNVCYCPIDTIGCVEIKNVEWPSRDQPDARPRANYLVRSKGELKRKGAGDLFIFLVQRMLAVAHADQSTRVDASERNAWKRQQQAEADHGVLKNFWMWLNGERDELKSRAKQAQGDAEQEMNALLELERALDDVSKRPLSNRARYLD